MKKNQMIYFDNAASTCMHENVIDKMTQFMREHFANSASVHQSGVRSSTAIEMNRQIIANSLNAKDYQVIFTSSGTEANNWILKSKISRSKKIKIITSPFEHKSILEPIKYLVSENFCEVEYVKVNSNGLINLEDLENKLKSDFDLASFMGVNNELGTIQPIEAIYEICQKYNVPLHVDACQSYLKVPLDLQKVPVDFITINSHKVHGPKGVGALVIKNKFVETMPALIHGGGHELGLRSSTMNTAGIVGFGNAVETNMKNNEFITTVVNLRNYFINQLIEKVPKSRLTCHEFLAPHIVNFGISGFPAKQLFGELNKFGIYLSTSSACNSTKLTPSYVLESIGLSVEQNLESVRISFSIYNTQEEIDILVTKINEIIK